MFSFFDRLIVLIQVLFFGRDLAVFVVAGDPNTQIKCFATRGEAEIALQHADYTHIHACKFEGFYDCIKTRKPRRSISIRILEFFVNSASYTLEFCGKSILHVFIWVCELFKDDKFKKTNAKLDKIQMMQHMNRSQL